MPGSARLRLAATRLAGSGALAALCLGPLWAPATRASLPPARVSSPAGGARLPRTEAPAGVPPSRPAEAAPRSEPDAIESFTGPSRRQRGVALGLFAEDVGFSYDALLAEIAAIGASHVALIVPLYQEHGRSTSLYLHTRFSPTLEGLANTIRLAKRHGLDVTVFPIVRLERPRGPAEWRGTLAPDDVGAWFSRYGEILGSLAAVASFTGATRLVVGSELSTLDTLTEHWAPLLERVRAVFGGTLVYSANWDHFEQATLLDLVDEAGVTGYFALRKPDEPGDVESLTRRWSQLRQRLETWAQPRRQPWLFTELGYRSSAGATATPWDETPGGTADPEEQARGFEAFRRAWQGGTSLGGLYVWNWYGYGGVTSTSYTPRGKPASEVVRRILSEL